MLTTRARARERTRLRCIRACRRQGYAAFESRWNEVLFENRFGKPATAANLEKQYGEHAQWVRRARPPRAPRRASCCGRPRSRRRQP
jgi:hypothetical protein